MKNLTVMRCSGAGGRTRSVYASSSSSSVAQARVGRACRRSSGGQTDKVSFLSLLHNPRRAEGTRCSAQPAGGESSPQMTSELKAAVDRLITENKIVLFMKGTKMFPQCGFSNTCVQIFNQLGAPFEDINVLEDERIRMGMKEYSQWPTFPQVYIEGEFYGGCDILLESYQSGELEEYVERVLAS